MRRVPGEAAERSSPAVGAKKGKPASGEQVLKYLSRFYDKQIFIVEGGVSWPYEVGKITPIATYRRKGPR